MQEMKALEDIYLKEFDIFVKSYLTYAQIQNIVNAVCKFDIWAERQQNIDILILHYATNLTDEEIEKHSHDYFLQSGLIDEVKIHIKNLQQIYQAIDYTQSTQRALNQIVKELPKLFEPLKRVKDNGSKSSKK